MTGKLPNPQACSQYIARPDLHTLNALSPGYFFISLVVCSLLTAIKNASRITRMSLIFFLLLSRSGPQLRDSDGPKELLESFKEDLKDIETHVRQGNLGGVANFEKWEKRLDAATSIKELVRFDKYLT